MSLPQIGVNHAQLLVIGTPWRQDIQGLRAVLDDFPTFSFNPQACKFRSGFLFGDTTCSEDTSDNLPERDRVVQVVRETVAEIANVSLVRTHELLCNGSLCDMTRGEFLLYSDDDHLNTGGSRYVGQEIVGGFQICIGRYFTDLRPLGLKALAPSNLGPIAICQSVIGDAEGYANDDDSAH